MLVPLSWLREYVAVDVPLDELAERINTSVAGLERIAMLRHGVPDLRMFWENDLRFLRQF